MFTVRPLRLALTATLTLASLVVVSQPWQTPAPIQRIAPTPVDTIVAAAEPIIPALSRPQVAVARGTLARAATAADVGDVPFVALSAYERAATIAGRVDKTCGLSWTLLAAIGGVESDHGRWNGSRLLPNGVSRPLIRGVVLDGAGRVAKVADTDAGRVDGIRRWDRAVGPMQFLPSTWATLGVDADGDGVRSADDIDDAALGAAVFLCAAPGSLDDAHGVQVALHRYNPSASYAARVIALEQQYSTGRYAPPDVPISVRAVGPLPTYGSSHPQGGPGGQAGHQTGGASGHQNGGQGHHGGDQGDQGDQGGHHSSGHNAGPSHEPTHEPSAPPTTEPSDPPTTDPTEPPAVDPSDPPTGDPVTVEVTGLLQACGTEQVPAWCVDDMVVDLGDEDYLATIALADFDGDGTVETNADEVLGLKDTEVTVVVSITEDDEVPRVLEIDGLAYVSDDDVDVTR